MSGKKMILCSAGTLGANLVAVVASLQSYEALFIQEEPNMEGFVVFFPNRILYLCFWIPLSVIAVCGPRFFRNPCEIYYMIRFSSRGRYANKKVGKLLFVSALYVMFILFSCFAVAALRGYRLENWKSIPDSILPFYFNIFCYIAVFIFIHDCLEKFIFDNRIQMVVLFLLPLCEAGIYKRQLLTIFRWLPAGNTLIYSGAENVPESGRMAYMCTVLLLAWIMRDWGMERVDLKYVD